MAAEIKIVLKKDASEATYPIINEGHVVYQHGSYFLEIVKNQEAEALYPDGSTSYNWVGLITETQATERARAEASYKRPPLIIKDNDGSSPSSKKIKIGIITYGWDSHTVLVKCEVKNTSTGSSTVVSRVIGSLLYRGDYGISGGGTYSLPDYPTWWTHKGESRPADFDDDQIFSVFFSTQSLSVWNGNIDSLSENNNYARVGKYFITSPANFDWNEVGIDTRSKYFNPFIIRYDGYGLYSTNVRNNDDTTWKDRIARTSPGLVTAQVFGLQNNNTLPTIIDAATGEKIDLNRSSEPDIVKIVEAVNLWNKNCHRFHAITYAQVGDCTETVSLEEVNDNCSPCLSVRTPTSGEMVDIPFGSTKYFLQLGFSNYKGLTSDFEWMYKTLGNTTIARSQEGFSIDYEILEGSQYTGQIELYRSTGNTNNQFEKTIKTIKSGKVGIKAKLTYKDKVIYSNVCEFIILPAFTITISARPSVRVSIGDTVTVYGVVNSVDGFTTDKFDWSYTREDGLGERPFRATTGTSQVGQITFEALSPGRYYVSCKAHGYDITSNTLELTAVATSPENVEINAEGADTIRVDETVELTFTTTPRDYTAKNISWTISDPSIVSGKNPNSGVFKITGLSEGTTNISIDVDGATASVPIVVYPRAEAGVPSEIEAVSLNLGVSFPVGEFVVPTVTIWPKGYEYETIEYTSSDETVIYPTPDGQLYSQSVGSAVITVFVDGKTDSKPVSVYAPSPLDEDSYAYSNVPAPTSEGIPTQVKVHRYIRSATKPEQLPAGTFYYKFRDTPSGRPAGWIDCDGNWNGWTAEVPSGSDTCWQTSATITKTLPSADSTTYVPAGSAATTTDEENAYTASFTGGNWTEPIAYAADSAVAPEEREVGNLLGTNVAAKIVPYTSMDNYATHDAFFGKGGFRSVRDMTELYNVPNERREEGMLAWVMTTAELYQLRGFSKTTPGSWMRVDFSGNGYNPSDPGDQPQSGGNLTQALEDQLEKLLDDDESGKKKVYLYRKTPSSDKIDIGTETQIQYRVGLEDKTDWIKAETTWTGVTSYTHNPGNKPYSDTTSKWSTSTKTITVSSPGTLKVVAKVTYLDTRYAGLTKYKSKGGKEVTVEKVDFVYFGRRIYWGDSSIGDSYDVSTITTESNLSNLLRYAHYDIFVNLPTEQDPLVFESSTSKGRAYIVVPKSWVNSTSSLSLLRIQDEAGYDDYLSTGQFVTGSLIGNYRVFYLKTAASVDKFIYKFFTK